MFEKLKNKLHSRKNREPTKATSGNKAPSVAAAQVPSSDNEVFMEKPVAEESVQQQSFPVQSDQQVPKQLHAPARDLWQDTPDPGQTKGYEIRQP
ncbi:hypothetical protein N7532_006092 [Penicillium argentinense]|uniref:Uncharacterized protein n=1 Tax=Penicillium argentinense TaxID=1131581 RepID=A0A9W9KB12_9EURO|nr:uncharacterized protein N7532_006092 [Penicillium argentinense]KAJ5099091.1 hypothetical protein N7532_006092 [Penicillium argentinense]